MSDTANLPINPKRIGIKTLILLVVLAVVWVARPLFHGIIYPTVYSPGGLYVIGIPLVAGLVLFFLPPLSDNKSESLSKKGTYLGIVFVVGLILAFSLGFLGGMFEEKRLAQDAMEDAEEIDNFPEVNAENPRIIPRAVADVQTRGSVSYRQHQLGASDIARAEDGDLVWSYPIQPDQFRNQFSGNQRGVLLSDMTTTEDRELQAYDEQEFKYGQNMFMHRSANWNLEKSDYWVQYRDDPVEFTHDGEAYMVFPKTGHEWHLLPVPHTTPTWEGVALVHTDGTIEHMSPEEARNSEILDGQRIYPLYNSQRYAESLEYRNGIINQLPIVGSFEGVIEPATLPAGAGNSQPFVIDLEGEEMSYTYAMEPAGEQTRGLDEVWLFDARTGEMRYYGTGGDTLLGPERAMGIIRSADTRTNWDTESSSGQFRVVEPVPTMINNELWWHAKVVPVDNTDVTRNSFVNAHTEEVVELEDTDSVVRFISGENPDNIDSVTTEEPQSESDDAEVYIVIRDDEGNVVDRTPVESNQSFDIEVDTSDDEESDNSTSTE